MYTYLYHSGEVPIVTLLSGPKEGQRSWAQIGKVHPHECHFSSNVDFAGKSQAKGLQFEDVYSSAIWPKMGKAGARKQGNQCGALAAQGWQTEEAKVEQSSGAKTPH